VYKWKTRPILRLEQRAAGEAAARRRGETIAVQDVLQRFAAEEHVARANAYFLREHEEDALFRRPYAALEEVQPRLAGLAYLLQQLELFPGARVLDFGCGTGWLSRVLATMGMSVIGTDVSENALALARKFIARDPLADSFDLAFRAFDSVRLPLEDASVDRIACFDAFHHVYDQEATLREMARVLKPGGIIAFHEPGPIHSTTPAAQSEMREYDVIENDIDVHRIWAMAETMGFGQIWISLPSIHAPLVGLRQLDRVAAGRPGRDDLAMIAQNVYDFTYNLRIFSLRKAA
jgi:2-polyprenyl-3-methyl-5-hydroxy-6-metoxy-1,4-benzoquinol methylase